MGILSADDIDEKISEIVISGPPGEGAALTLARIAGRALKMLHEVVGPQAALVTAKALVEKLSEGKVQ